MWMNVAARKKESYNMAKCLAMVAVVIETIADLTRPQEHANEKVVLELLCTLNWERNAIQTSLPADSAPKWMNSLIWAVCLEP